MPLASDTTFVWEGPMRLVENVGRWGTYEGETVSVGGRDLGEEVRLAAGGAARRRVRITLEVLDG